MFKPARKAQAKARVAIVGPAGSGKTFTALEIARGIGGRIALIDTEHKSAAKYADRFDFDTDELTTHHPDRFIEKIIEAERAGYDVLIIDSLSHAWMGADGALELVDNAAKRSRSQNTFNAWRDVTPLHNKLCEAILAAKMHVIATMRAKTEYVLEEVNGKKVPRKIGMAPVQRDGMEYLYDIVGDMDHDHNLVVTKSRCFELADKVVTKPGCALGQQIAAWLSDVPVQATEQTKAPVPAEPTPVSPATPPTPPRASADLVAEIKALTTAHGVAWCKEVCGGVSPRTDAQLVDAIAKIKAAVRVKVEAQALVDDVFGVDPASVPDPFEEAGPEKAGGATPPSISPPDTGPPPRDPGGDPPKKRAPKGAASAKPGTDSTQPPETAPRETPDGAPTGSDSKRDAQGVDFISEADFWSRVQRSGIGLAEARAQICRRFELRSAARINGPQREVFLRELEGASS